MQKIQEVVVHGKPFSISIEEIGDDEGDFDAPAGSIRIHTESRFKMRVLVHEMSHAALNESGVEHVLTDDQAEAVCTAMEGAFGPLLSRLMGERFEL